MQIKKAFVLCIFAFTASIYSEAKDSDYRLKDGRQFTLDLVRIFEIPHYELRPLFNSLRQSLPKKGNLSEFYGSMSSMAKLASFACDYVDFLEGPTLTISSTYNMILGRLPTESEIKEAILIQNKFSFFENCFYLTMHPEFILIKK